MKKVLQGIMLIVALITTNTILAQSGNIKGKLVDENGLALPGATVLVSDLENVGAVSNIDGSFVIYRVPSGDHQLKVEYIGYKDIEQSVSVPESGTSETISIALEPGVIIGEEVLVLGDRLKGQAKAINKQKNNQNITNIVASDQIGRFPDANVGDAMKRIPGITMQGDQGEARNIVIRGLQPQLNSVMINGNRIPSAEGDNRNIQMDLIPSDMIQAIEVNKAVTPDMDGDAIGGSVNLVTRMAPSGSRISGTLASGYNALSEKPIWTGGVVLSNRFFEDKLGAVLSASYNNHQFGSDNMEAEWTEGDDIDAYVEEFQIRQYEVQRVRRSISLGLDYEFNSAHKIYFNGIYNHRDDWENRYRQVIKDIGEPDASGVSFVEAIERQSKGGIGNDRVDYRRLEDQRVRTFSVGGDHLLGKVKLNWSGAWAKASEKRPNERYAEYVAEPEVEIAGEDEPQGMLFFQDISNPRKPMFTPAPTDGFSLAGNDPSLTSLSLFEFGEITEEFQDTYETDFNSRIDLQIPVNTKGIIKTGVRMRSKEKVRDNTFFEYEFTGDEFESLDLVPGIDKSKDNFLAGEQYQSGVFASDQWLGDLDLTNSTLFDQEAKPDEYLAQNYSANEDIVAAYAMITYDVNDKFTVLAGGRVEQTSIEYTGNQVENEEDFIGSVTASQDYTNFLPGLHLKYSFSENLIARAAWTNTLARPNYYDLVPYRDDRPEDEELFIGNPTLDPTTAMNFDLSVENYFKSIGLVSVGYFNKSIDNFIYTSVSDQSISGIDYEVYQALNGGNATINGFEIAFQRQLDFLPGALKGLGVYLNYTNTSSSAEGVANEDGDVRNDLDLPGSAENLFNASLSYETKKLVVRASLNFSSDYIDEVGGDAFSDRYYDKQTFLDVNASYAFTPNWRLFFEANNLTNQPLRYYQGQQDRTMQVEYYNSRFNLGVKFDLFNK
ncbi:MAG: TonB-dependent receptor [Cyclobacteriaceae bacterium]